MFNTKQDKTPNVLDVSFLGRGQNTVSHDLSETIEFLKSLLLRVIDEYDTNLANLAGEFIELIEKERSENDIEAFNGAQEFINRISLDDALLLTRMLTCFFHLANVAEENYRVHQLKQKETTDYEPASGNAINQAYNQLMQEVGEQKALRMLQDVKFYPVLTAHPTEARRKAISGKLQRIGKILTKLQRSTGVSRLEYERKLMDEIDAIFRTSPIALQKPTPVEESNTVISAVDETLFDTIIQIMRRFDDIAKLRHHNELSIGGLKPIPEPFFELGSWIGSDRDGNPNVTAKITRTIADNFSNYITNKISERIIYCGRNLTLESNLTKPSSGLQSLWAKLKHLDEKISEHISVISNSEPHRSVLMLIGERVKATSERNFDFGYESDEQLLSDLQIVQDSLLEAGANRAAYGLLQTIIWQVKIFGFHLASMEVRQHSQIHLEALNDIRENGINSDKLKSQTKEVIDTFRAIGAIQRKYGVKAINRYIVSFTQETSHIKDVFELAKLSEPNDDLVAKLSVIPLFETMDDLERSVEILKGMIKLPQIKQQIKNNDNKIEVMLGYSDSSKDVGPVAATFALHDAQEKIAEWAKKNGLHLVLFHGRGGALGRGGGPAHRALMAQPSKSVNGIFKITEQGESITARYANPSIAVRHIETIIGATLLNGAPSQEKQNDSLYKSNRALVNDLVDYSKASFHDLVQSEDFANWFAEVTPLEEIGLLPIGSRPAKRGLTTRSLEDLRAIPWVFAWSQARVNLAAWYGFGSAIESIVGKYDDPGKAIDMLRATYRDWNLFSTLIDNIEMAVAKTDERIAMQYLSLSERDDLSKKVISELRKTTYWLGEITNSVFPLSNKKVLGQAIQIRGPYVDALSQLQFAALKKLRKSGDTLTDEEKGQIQYLLLCTVSGISAGLQNTG